MLHSLSAALAKGKSRGESIFWHIFENITTNEQA